MTRTLSASRLRTVAVLASLLLISVGCSFSVDTRLHNHNQRTADPLVQPLQDVVVGIITYRSAHFTRIPFVTSSWASADLLNSSIFVVSDVADNSIPSVRATGCDTSYLTSAGLCCKTAWTFEWLFAYFPEKKWFLRAMDDTAVFLPNLEGLLRQYNADEEMVIGFRQVARPSSRLERFEDETGEYGEIVYPQGGAGWIVSRQFMRSFSAKGELKRYRQLCERFPTDDLAWGIWMKELGIRLTHYPGISRYPVTLTHCLMETLPCGAQPQMPVTFHMSQGTYPSMPEVVRIIRDSNFTLRLVSRNEIFSWLSWARRSDDVYWRLCPCMQRHVPSPDEALGFPKT